MSPEQAIAFVEKYGVVLESASGPVPSLARAIAGEELGGSWWSHPRGKEIFRLTRAVRASPQILVCRLLAGKITFVHERLWPALVRAAPRLQPEQLARVIEEHTASGKHSTSEVPFPAWVSPAVRAAASKLSEAEAARMLNSIAAGLIATR